MILILQLRNKILILIINDYLVFIIKNLSTMASSDRSWTRGTTNRILT